MATKKQAQKKKPVQGQKKFDQGLKKADNGQKKFDHAGKSVEVTSAYKAGVEGMVKAGMIVADYQDALADNREFTAFWRDHLGWAKSTVYRLADAGRHFSHLPGQTLAYFDLSALYLLASKRAKPGVRVKAIKKAQGGQFVTHAEAKGWVGTKPANPANPPRPGKLRVDKAKLNAESKKLGLDPKAVIELWERLGVTVAFEGTEPGKGAA